MAGHLGGGQMNICEHFPLTVTVLPLQKKRKLLKPGLSVWYLISSLRIYLRSGNARVRGKNSQDNNIVSRKLSLISSVCETK